MTTIKQVINLALVYEVCPFLHPAPVFIPKGTAEQQQVFPISCRAFNATKLKAEKDKVQQNRTGARMPSANTKQCKPNT